MSRQTMDVAHAVQVFRALLNISNDGFGVVGPLGNIIYMSPSFVNLTGFASHEMEG
jgi:PAS domain S-box-containing protein